MYPVLRSTMAESSVTVFGPALDLMKHVKTPEGQMLTKPFLDVCRNVLPVIGTIQFSLCLAELRILKL